MQTTNKSENPRLSTVDITLYKNIGNKDVFFFIFVNIFFIMLIRFMSVLEYIIKYITNIETYNVYARALFFLYFIMLY